MIQEHKKKELYKVEELPQLSNISLITSFQDLYKEVRNIDEQHGSMTAKTAPKLKLICKYSEESSFAKHKYSIHSMLNQEACKSNY